MTRRLQAYTRTFMYKSILSYALLFSSLLLLTGCGGGNNNSSGNDQNVPPPNYSISVSPSTLALNRGGNATVTVSLAPQNGFSGSASVTISGLSSGVTVSPSSLSVSSGNPGTLTFTASANAEIAQTNVTLQATSGSLQANSTVSVTVNGEPIPDRFRLIGGSLGHGFYDEQRHLLFATNGMMNELDVISGTDLKVQSRLNLPQAWGIDQMADGKTLVVGTSAQQIATVDEDTLAVTLHPVPNGSSTFALFYPNVVALANGKVLIIGQEQGIESNDIVEGGQYLLEWDSTTDTFTKLLPTTQLGFEVDSLARSADHKWAVFSADQFYLYSSDSDSFTTVPLETVNPPRNDYNVRGYAMNADGSKIAVASASQLTVLDRSFHLLGTVQIPNAFQEARSRVQFSPDGSKLILQYPLPTAIEMIDLGTYTALGYLSADVEPSGNDNTLMAVDSNWRAFVTSTGGLLTVDLTQPLFPNPQMGTPLPAAFCPALQSPGAALNTSAEVMFNSSSGITQSFFLAGQPAPLTPKGNSILVPASPTAGPVNVECEGADGNRLVEAVAFSYGVTPVSPSANLLPPTGNTVMDIFGFGLWSSESNLPTINIGGQPTSKPVYMGNLQFGVLQGATFMAPPGAPGQTADLYVSSSYGQATQPAAVQYLPAAKIVSASNLEQLLFDKRRNLLYALKTEEIDVLDPATLTWKAPIPLPTSGGAANYTIMGLSPDGSRIIAVSPNYYAAVLDPDNPSGATVVSYHSNLNTPISLAITRYNKALMPGSNVVEIDLSSLAVKTFQANMGKIIRASADGSALYGLDIGISSGQVYTIDPATYAVTQPPSFGHLYWSDLAVSADGSQAAAVATDIQATGNDIGFFDPALRMINLNVYPFVADPDFGGVAGPLFSPGGKVIATGLSNSIEFWDTQTGKLRARLLTPETLQWTPPTIPNSAPLMASDPTGQTLFVGSTSGITVLTLPQPMDDLKSYEWNDSFGLQAQQAGGAHSNSIRNRRLGRRSR